MVDLPDTAVRFRGGRLQPTILEAHFRLSAWPAGTRLILRKERPHPGVQLRITDHDGMRVTGFLTNTAPGGPAHQLADLELRHRRHARVEDRIRNGKDTGLRNLPARSGPEPDLVRDREPGV